MVGDYSVYGSGHELWGNYSVYGSEHGLWWGIIVCMGQSMVCGGGL